MGSRGRYQWFTSSEHYLGDIVRSCPEVLLGRYLAVTSTDSGEPTWAQKLPGWECTKRVAYSPRLDSTEGISYQLHGPENAGFDEWYLFEARTELGEVIGDENPWTEEFRSRPGARIVAFVNHYFSPDLPDDVRSSLFWDQMERILPESYISDGAKCVTFVTGNDDLFQSVCRALTSAATTRTGGLPPDRVAQP